MPENNFEQQVQQKMDELQLRPSETVWEEVEKRIRKEKKRRRFILWMFFAGVVLLGGTSWWLVSDNKNKPESHEVIAQTPNDKKANAESLKITNNTTGKEAAGNTSETGFAESKKDSLNQLTKVVADNKRISSIKIDPLVVVIKPTQVKQKKATKSTPNWKKQESETATTVSIDADKTILTAQPTIADSSTKSNVIAKTESKNSDSIVANKKSISAETDKNEKTTSTSLIDKAIAKIEETAVKKDSSKTKKNKWEIGVTGFAGSSVNSDGFTILGVQKSMERSSQFSQSGGATAPIAFAPYPTKGFAWQLGAYVKRKFTEKTGLSIGFNFSAYSTQQLTGAYVDNINSLTTSYYRSGSSTNFINKYYYLQLPVSFHWQLNKSKKLPFVFQNGLSVGLLAGTDALVYNSSFNGFYKDNKSFNKLQVSYQTGLYTKLFNQSQKPVTVGLLFNYHLTRLQKVDSYGGNHLSSFGVQLGWLFKK